MPTPPVRPHGALTFEPSGTAVSLSSPPPKHVHDRTISSFNTAVQLIGVVNNFLTPIPLAKEVLVSVAGILEIIKVTYANQSDFHEVAEQCQMIGLTVWNATSGSPDHRVDDRVERALSTLQTSVDNIRNKIEQKKKSNIISKVFHSTLNKETIAKWKTDLDRCLAVFNTDLNISAHAKLDELLGSFQEFRDTLAANIQSTSDPVPNELPPRPQAFFGRDGIVHDTVKHLIECSKVALIGPGGIGKSSIARAVLNDEALVTKFGKHRYFVRFDDMDVSQATLATFLDRIARVWGYNTSVNAYNMISRALATSETLLVLDNAETFLDAPVDGGRIADAIDEFGARPNVTFLLTTRTTVLPPNLKWIRTRVPSLDESDACEAFKMFYSPSIEISTLLKVLAAVDFHPLCINLLAQAAVQNEWSPQELITKWNNQRASLLEVGSGKIQSLAVTIEASLSSPSICKLGVIIRHFLQIIAFLPQGVNVRYLSSLFMPQLSQIESCKVALCRQSLAYLDGDFITLLAPIRLYITSKTKISENPLFQQVLSHYTQSQSEFRVRQEDLNMERIFTYYLSSRTATTQVVERLNIFICHLWQVKPRPISAIRRALSSLSPKDLAPSSRSWITALREFPHTQRKMALIAKAECLFSMSLLMRFIGQTAEAEESQAEARALLLVLQKQLLISFDRTLAQRLINDFDNDVARIHYSMGNYRAAEELFRSLLERTSFIRKYKTRKSIHAAEIRLKICLIQSKRGKHGMSKEILKDLPLFEDNFQPSFVWQYAGEAELNDGRLDLAKEYFRTAKGLCKGENVGSYTYIRSVAFLAEVAYLGRDKMEFTKLREQALTIAYEVRAQSNRPTMGFMADIDKEMDFFSALAGYLAIEGNIDQARELLRPYHSLKSYQDVNRYHWPTVIRLYAAGCIELHAGDLTKAEEYFQQAKEACIAIQELRFRILSERALGEIAVKRQDMVAAKAHFEATSELCEITGMPKNKLYYELSCFKPSEVYDGWRRYQEDPTMPGPLKYGGGINTFLEL